MRSVKQCHLEIVDAAKLRIRKMSSDILDEDVAHLLEFAEEDLKRIGVLDKWIERPDALIREAEVVYAQANFGATVNNDLMFSYNSILTKIKGSRKYFHESEAQQ